MAKACRSKVPILGVERPKRADKEKWFKGEEKEAGFRECFYIRRSNGQCCAWSFVIFYSLKAQFGQGSECHQPTEGTACPKPRQGLALGCRH